MLRWGIIVILSLGLLRVCAQSRVISFRHYSAADGLTDQHVRCIEFDKEGYLWIGTHGGLHRFDGEKFEVFRKPKAGTTGVCGNIITSIEEDENGELWVGTADAGLCHVDIVMNMNIQPALIAGDQIPVTAINDIKILPDRNLLVSTESGLFLSQSSYQKFDQVLIQFPHAYYELFKEDAAVYCGRVVGGVIWYQDGVFHNHPVEPALSPGHTLQTFYKASDGKVYAGSWDDYLHIVNRKEPFLEHISMTSQLPELAGDEIVAITEAEQGFLWLATKSGILVQYELATGIFRKIEVSNEERKRLHGSRIYDMLTDNHGRTWIATNAGLHVYNPLQSVFEIQWLPEDHAVVEDILVDDQRIYVASLNGLFAGKGNTWKYIPDSDNSKYKSYLLHRRGEQILVGTNKNLMHLRQDQLQPYYPKLPYAISGLISSRIDGIASYTWKGKEYFIINIYGYGTAIGEVNGPNWHLGMVSTGTVKENLVNDIFKDRKGAVWFAGTSLPVTKFQYGELFGKEFPLIPWGKLDILETIMLRSELFQQDNISQHCEDIIEDGLGNFWVASQGSGLLKLNPERKPNCFDEIPQSPLSVNKLCVDETNRIWMLSSGGLHCYDPVSGLWMNYTELDGLPSGGLYNGLTIDTNGVIYAGGQGFIATLDTKRQWISNENPTTKITGYDVNGIHYLSGTRQEELVFPFDKNFIQIYFSSMCFTAPEKYQFEYKLSGTDDQWHSIGSQNSVTFNQLPPGDYTFWVRSVSENGVVEGQSRGMLKWRVLPPFYRTWWFSVLVVALVASVVAGFMMYRMRQYRKIEEVRNKLARDLHDDVGSALGSISFYSETAKLSIDYGNFDQARRIALKMGETSRKMIENIHDIIWAVNPSHDDSAHLVERMRTHIADIHSNGGIKIQFNVHPEISSLRLDMKARRNMYLVFKEAIYNAIKYSESPSLEVNLARTGKLVVLEVRDFGKGFEYVVNRTTGNGLRNMNIRADELSGHLEISSSNSGTIIKLSFPIV